LVTALVLFLFVDYIFELIKMNLFNNNDEEVKFWIEKTITNKRIDRLEGERALGKALWSPMRGQNGADIYRNMTLVKKGDYVIHLVDNSYFSGISQVKSEAIETVGIEGTDWEGPAYLIYLENYTNFKKKLDRQSILKLEHKIDLENISKSSEVFYNKDLNLRQGAYLTPCPIELLKIINFEYLNLCNENIPLLSLSIENIKFNQFTNLNVTNFQLHLKQSGLIFSPQLIQRFVASLCTKPFVICSGLSGSGKTKLAQAYVQWICESENQYKIIPVGADWTNREPLLGYPNGLEPKSYVTPDSGALQLILEASKEENQIKPYFMILDEMNLSHVERYFADFLSIMESGDRIKLYSGADRIDSDKNAIPQEISFPSNLFIIGTVNIDETTYMFSPKVLDRANTIEFRLTENDLEEFIASNIKLDMDVLKTKGANMSDNFISLALKETEKNLKSSEADLKLFFTELKKSGAEFGYRTASEIGRLMYMLKELGEDGDNLLDIAIMQKLLPKLHGSRNKLTKVLPILGGFCLNNNTKIKEDYLDKFVSNNLNEEAIQLDTNIKYKISFEKICRMYKNAIENGFASYAEA
jgi:hypothetical protein